MQDPASAPYQRGASSAATTDASQLGSAASAPQPGVTGPRVQLNIGTLNFGATQSMFAGNNCNKHNKNLQRVVGKMVEAGNLDLLLGCEMSGRKQGPAAAGIRVGDVMDGLLTTAAKTSCAQLFFGSLELEPGGYRCSRIQHTSRGSIVELHCAPSSARCARL
jgi:hypothetical protein